MPTLVNKLNELAKRIPRDAFKAQGETDCVTYVCVRDGDVLYVGEGLPLRATLRFEQQGVNDPDLDDIIAMFPGEIYVYRAASSITKAVSRELEHIIRLEYNPPFNVKPTSSIWRSLPQGPDTFDKMRSAEKLDYRPARPPRETHVGHWKRCLREMQLTSNTSLRVISAYNPWRAGSPGDRFWREVLTKRPATFGEAMALGKACSKPFTAKQAKEHLLWLYTWGGFYIEIDGKRWKPE
jgi:hypothetical protein